jgi:threonyl-tRNA synthetase
VPVMLVVGRKEGEERTVSIRRLGSPQSRTLPLDQALAELVAEATFPDLRRAQAVASSVPSAEATLDSHHGQAPVP